MDNVQDIQKYDYDIKEALTECKKIKGYLYIFTKAVSYDNITKFMEAILLTNNSKMIR